MSLYPPDPNKVLSWMQVRAYSVHTSVANTALLLLHLTLSERAA